MARPDNSKQDFRNHSKAGANFRKHKLYMARFEFSHFPNSDFSAVSAKQCCFIKANLRGSDFTGANLHGANFRGADLREVNFKSAVLHHVDFENALTEGANFLGASINMCRQLKLSDAQKSEIDKQKQIARIDLEKRKSAPEYQKKMEERLLKKPWVERISDLRQSGGAIVVVLKPSYTFKDSSEPNLKTFTSFEEAHEGTVKAVINRPDPQVLGAQNTVV